MIMIRKALAICCRWQAACCGVALTIFSSAAQALEKPSSMTFNSGTDVIALPGIGRVIVAFLLVAALAVAAAVALKRWMPRYGSAVASSSDLRILRRSNLGGGLQIYLLQADKETVLLAQSRNGLALTVLKKSQEQV